MQNLVTVHNPPQRFQQLLETLIRERFASRLAAKDTSLWPHETASIAANRLGWLDFAASANQTITAASELRGQLNNQGVNDIVLCGMGGSSLAPELISAWYNVPLTVFDAVHPAAVRAQFTRPLTHTAVVISSKSGTTTETRNHLSSFEQAFRIQNINPAARIIVVTDPDSDLDRYATSQGYRTFLADPTVGGRFSALTVFGMVPAILAGAELGPLITEAEELLPKLLVDSPDNPALVLAAFLLADPDRFTAFIAPSAPEYAGLGDWIEQLLAESSGKAGKGILPIACGTDAAGWEAGQALKIFVPDVLPAALAPNEAAVTCELGQQFLLWEVATAAVGFLLATCPFDQPDVEVAKQAARELLTAPEKQTKQVALADSTVLQRLETTVSPVFDSVASLLTQLETALADPRAYLMLQAYTGRSEHTSGLLEQLRIACLAAYKVPVAAGFGPRYLHSTGQFHKGGTGKGVFLQLLENFTDDYNFAAEQASYGQLLFAQATGDAQVLTAKNRTVFTVTVTDFAKACQELLTALANKT